MRLLYVPLVVGLIACSGSPTRDDPPPAEGTDEIAVSMDPLPEEPDRRSCQSDDDCVSTYDSDREPCCVAGPGAVVYTRAYVEWRQRWMEEHCRDAQCPPEPTPPPPVACRLEARCTDRQCTDTCSD